MKKLLLVLLVFVSGTAYDEIYTWKDSRGTVHYTNSMYEIPARYLGKAKALDLGIDQKKESISSLPIGPAHTVRPAEQPAAQGTIDTPPPQNAPAPPVVSNPVDRQQLRATRRQERGKMRRGDSQETD